MARADRTTLARRIKARRLELGLTQREVAGEDFTRGFISQVENGLIDPSLKSLEIIAQRLGSPISYFLEDSDAVDPVAVETSVRHTYDLLDSDLEAAAAAAAVALSGAERLGNPALLARARSGAAWVAYYNEGYSEAASLFGLSAEAHRTAGNLTQTLRALNAAGTAAHRAEDYPAAATYYTSALELARTLEEPGVTDHLRILVNLGLLLTHQEKTTEATSYLQQALELSIAHKEYYRHGEVHSALGVNHRRLGNIDKAIDHYRQAFQFYQAVQESLHAAHAVLNCGNAYAVSGEYAQARQLHNRALQTYEELGETVHAANARAELATVAWHEGHLEEASSLAEAALEHLTDEKERGRMLVMKARVLAKEEEIAAAVDLYRQGLPLLGENENTKDIAEACYELGDLLMRQGKAGEASPYLARAAGLYRRLKG
ncbi:MAG: tetratricopeptide repeat protein [Limnochordia bacterium]